MDKILNFLLLKASQLPLSLTYKASSILYFLASKIIRYRKSTVVNNLKSSFPEKTEKEIAQITSTFYKNFVDYFLETLRLRSIPLSHLQERVEIENQEILEKYKAEGKNVVLLVGHVFNFEWLASGAPSLNYNEIYVAYKKIRSAFWDKESRKIRSRFNAIPIPSSEVGKKILSVPRTGEYMFVLVSDQSPGDARNSLFIDFLNQPTSVFQGFEKLCLKANMIPIYIDITKVKQGKYKYKLIPIEPVGDKYQENEITHTFFKLLENNIKRDPSNWLWTHKRWKHKLKNNIS